MRRTWLVTLAFAAACSGGAIEGDAAGGGAGTGAAASGSPQAGGAAAEGGGVVPGTPGAPAVETDCNKVSYAPRRIWRLTPTQYDNTLRDLFGIEGSFGSGFPADEVGVGFSNAADALLMTPLLADKVASAAQDISAKVELSRIASCTTAQRDEACLREFVTKLGERAFRRPITAAESERYLNLARMPGDFESGARLVVLAMLQSPSFLYRYELGQPSQTKPGVYELDDYEIASELSYLLWQTMPDDALMQAAKAGRLHDKAELDAQVARMLGSERARPMVRRFVFDWLGLSTIATVPKDTVSFPELTSDIRASMVKEAESFVDAVMFGMGAGADGSITALLRGKPAALDDALAKFYGSAARSGMLTLGGVILTHSRSNDSSPIHRGKLVRERLLCQPLPPPPPGLDLTPPGLDPSKTARERYAEHSSNAFCGNCHKLMDPIGLAFEHFDGIGRYRADDNGLPIDPSGEIVLNDVSQYPPTDADGKFANLEELITKLEASDDVRRCYALSWFRFAYGEGRTERDGEGYPSCQAQRYQDSLGATSGSLPDIVRTLTQADWFMTRTGPDPSTIPIVTEPEPEPAPTPAADGGVPQVPVDTVPGATPGLAIERTVDNDWGQGYCYTYQVRNTTAAAITWSVPLDVRGMMNNHWQCKVSAMTGAVTFTGEDYNSTIEPNGMAEFGFCAVTP